jgi:hypothetical protein
MHQSYILKNDHILYKKLKHSHAFILFVWKLYIANQAITFSISVLLDDTKLFLFSAIMLLRPMY